MSRTNFENLRVYKLSEDLADSIWNIASRWDFFNRDTLGKQIVKSADSIGANIAEGTGRYGVQDNKRLATLRVAHSMKQNTGLGGLIKEIF